MPTSRAFDTAPLAFRATMYVVGHFLLPILKYFTTSIKTTKSSGLDLVTVSVDAEFKGARGYFLGRKSGTSSLESRDEVKQEELWVACEKWVKLDPLETALKISRQC
jgi:WW domain-containing oxidoreductase